MERFRNVLYLETHVGGCGRSFACALDVARAHDARLTVAGATGDPGSTPGLPPAVPLDRFGGLTSRQAWALRLQHLAASAGEHAPPVRTRTLEGDPADALIQEVGREEYDLVMKVADRGKPRWLASMAGGDRVLLRQCPSPVWLLHPAQGPGIRLVLAAVDVDDSAAEELNRRIVRIAIELARCSRSKLLMLHAWSIVGEPILTSSMTGLSRQRLRNLLARTRRQRRRQLERLLEQEGAPPATQMLTPKGDPVRTIRTVARRTQADVVVVGHAAHEGLNAFLFGNVAERLVGTVPGSILSVRAPGVPSGTPPRSTRPMESARPSPVSQGGP